MNAPRQVHLFFPFVNDIGGSEMRTLEIARGLRERGVPAQVWATSSKSSRELRRCHDIRLLTPLHRPRGSFIFVGCYWRPKGGLMRCRPDRLTVIVNTMAIESFRDNLRFYRALRADVRFAYTSQLQCDLFGEPGDVHLSPIDLERFFPREPAAAPDDVPFRVGRMSRESLGKHHLLYDPLLYAQIIQEGMKVDLMGADCIRSLLPVSEHVTVRSAGAADPAEFLRGLDCFFYRTGAFYDPAARVVWEAMASGLPVVCHRFGGHADRIVHGENGFLFDDQREALTLLRTLRDDRALRLRVGAAARASMEHLMGSENLSAQYRSYVGMRTA